MWEVGSSFTLQWISPSKSGSTCEMLGAHQGVCRLPQIAALEFHIRNLCACAEQPGLLKQECSRHRGRFLLWIWLFAGKECEVGHLSLKLSIFDPYRRLA